MNVRRLVLSLMFVLLTTSAFCQTPLTGSAIPDSTANRLYLLHLSNLDAQTQQNYLTNNAQLPSEDITTATAALSMFKTQYNQAVSQYNDAVNGQGFSQGILTTFQNQQANITSTTIGYMQNHLTAVGYSGLLSDVAQAKNNMETPSQPTGTMGCCYSTITSDTVSVISWTTTPIHATVTYSRTLEGNTPTVTDPNIRHQGNVREQVGLKVSSVTSAWVTPNIYINNTVSVGLDTFTDSCLTDLLGCSDVSTDGVTCSQGGQIYYVQLSTHKEFAYTLVAEHGARFGCVEDSNHVLHCKYPVINWCDGTHTPPDASYTGQNIGDVALWAYWYTANFCARSANSGPWTCLHGGALGTNSLLSPARCTYHP